MLLIHIFYLSVGGQNKINDFTVPTSLHPLSSEYTPAPCVVEDVVQVVDALISVSVPVAVVAVLCVAVVVCF